MFRSFDPDGLNQLATVNGAAASYDSNGNMTADPVTAKAYLYYSSNNLLRNTPSPWTSLDYDAFDRLLYTEYPTTYYVFDGNDQIAQYDGSNVLQKRYAFDGTGWPLVQYDAAGNRTWMLPDERGSIVALANDSAAMTAINTYDEYGIPAPGNVGTFQYASMMWLSGPGLYAPTFRAYAQHLGRFNQTDPLGYAGGINLYNYTGNDPVNRADPLGLADSEILVTAFRLIQSDLPTSVTFGDNGPAVPRDYMCGSGECTVTVRAHRPVIRASLLMLNLDLGRLAQNLFCTLPAINIGGGADLYAVAGGSLGGGIDLDFAHGRFGVSGYTGVGVGFGADVGPNFGLSPSGGHVISANLAANAGFALPVAPGTNIGASGTYNAIGTDPGFAGGGVGRAGTPLVFANVGANIGFATPSLYSCQ